MIKKSMILQILAPNLFSFCFDCEGGLENRGLFGHYVIAFLDSTNSNKSIN